MAIFNAPKVFKLVILKILFTMRLCNFKFSFEILQLPLVPSTKLPPPSDTNSSANIQIFDPPPLQQMPPPPDIPNWREVHVVQLRQYRARLF